MDAILNSAIALIPAWTDMSALFLDAAIKGVLLLVTASILVLSLRNASAAARHLVWCIAVCGLLVLPAVSLIAPRWTVPGLPAIALGHRPAEFATLKAAEEADVTVTGRERLPTMETVSSNPAAARIPETGSVVPIPNAFSPSIAPVSTGTFQPAVPESAVRPLDWGLVLPVVWIVGVFVLLTWILGGLVRAWLLVRSAREVTRGPLGWLFDELCDELEITGWVTLLQTRGSTMPMAWGIRPRILLPADADEWTDARLRAVLLHELAHVRRRDYLTQLVARFSATINWFNPLVWVAIHRMRVERELACDDQVLRAGSRPSEYASHLLEIARAANGRGLATFGGVAMARRSRLSDRLLAVLDDRRRRASVTPRMAAAAWAGAACFLLPIAGAGFGTSTEKEHPLLTAAFQPAVATTPDSAVPIFSTAPTQSNVLSRVSGPPARSAHSPGFAQSRCDWYSPSSSTSNWMSGEDDDYQVRITMDDCRLDVEIVGDIVFDDADSDIIAISRRGYFEMEERDGRARRRIVIEPANDGDLVRRWFVDGDERQYDSEASSWLRDMIPLLFRRVGLQAEERAGRILDRQGVDGVLQEITLIPSDYVARKYYQVVLTDGNLDSDQLRTIVRQAGNELESDYELAQLLVEVAENHPVDESVMVVYVEAAGSLESDYEQRRVLDAILSRPGLSQDVAEAMLRLATDIESDYELAELLIGILNRYPVDEVLTREFFDAVQSLDSDYEHNRVLKVALHAGAPNMQVLDLSLESATNIDSDYERAELLLEVARLYPVDRDIPASYLVAAQSLDSDYELGRVLKYLIDHQRLGEDALAEVMDAALKLDSDYELAALLLEVVDRYELSDGERETYFQAVTSIESDYELGRVLQAIVERGPLSEQNLRAVLTSAGHLGSEYELANLLISVADNYTLNEDLRTIFMRSVDTISSDYERGRVLSALNPRGGRLD